jgi:hypothetical protein
MVPKVSGEMLAWARPMGETIIPLFALLGGSLSRFRSPPLLDALDMLLGPVGFRVGTPPNAPDSFRAADLGEPPCS